METIETAPKDRPILAWCDHEAAYYETVDGGLSLNIYIAHGESLSYAPTGWHIIEWGSDGFYDYPDWWFVAGSEFEIVANPTHWTDLPAKPEKNDTISEEQLILDRLKTIFADYLPRI